LLAGILDIYLQMVLKVLADARKIVDDINAEAAEFFCVANS